MKLNNFKIVFILVGIIIIFFLGLYIINNKTIKEKFTSLIGTSDNSLSTYDTDISGVYIPVPNKKTEYNSVDFNVNIIPKGQEVIIFINKVKPKFDLGEFCSSNDDCITQNCDTTGTYNAKGLCVKKTSSANATGSKNTISNIENRSIYYIDLNESLKLLLNGVETEIDTNVTQLKYGYNNVIYYVKNNELYKYQYLQSIPIKKNIDAQIKPNSLIDTSKSGNVFWIGNDDKIYKYNGSKVDLNISDAVYVSSYSSNYIWYTTPTSYNLVPVTHLYFTKLNSTPTKVDIAAQIIKIKGVSESLCYYLTHLNILYLYHNSGLITSNQIDDYVTDMDAYNNTIVYYLKNKKLHKCNYANNYKKKDLSSLSTVNFKKLKTIDINTVLLISDNNETYKYNGSNIHKFPENKPQLTNVSDFIYTFEYISLKYPYNNNTEECYISMLGDKIYKNNKEYINIKSNKLLNKNCNGTLKNLFPKNSKINIINDNKTIYLKSSNNKYYKKINELDTTLLNTTLLNFDTNSLNRMTYNIPQIKTPKITYNSGECPYGTYKCTTNDDNNTESYFCGQQDSNNVNKCIPNSVICALDNNNKQYPSQDVCNNDMYIDSMYKLNYPQIGILDTYNSLLNTKYYGNKNDPNINCNFILNSILNNKLNNLYIMTHIRNENNKMVFKCLDTEFVNPSQDGSSLVVTDTLLTNLLNKNPTSENYTNALASFIGMLSIDSILEGIDKNYLEKCRNEFIRTKKCNYSQTEIEDLENSCNKILYDIEDIEAQINKMEVTQFKIELSRNMSIGENICSFYLKSYKTYSNLSPFYYLTANTNGSTSLSLIKGGHLQNKSINSNTQSQLWYFEKVDSFIIDDSKLKIFRTLIRSANGLYLEPSDGDIHGFSKTGQNNVYKVNLIRIPTKYWFIIATEFNSDVAIELGKAASNLLYQSSNTTRTSYSCPLTYTTKTGNSVDGYYCCNGSIYGDNCTGEKCCLHPGLTGKCNTTCCTTEVCPTDMPIMKDGENGKCFNEAGKSCLLGTTAVDGADLCYQ
jgi:hypothetical protein